MSKKSLYLRLRKADLEKSRENEVNRAEKADVNKPRHNTTSRLQLLVATACQTVCHHDCAGSCEWGSEASSTQS